MLAAPLGQTPISRRRLLTSAGLLGAASLLAACAPAPAAAPTTAPAAPTSAPKPAATMAPPAATNAPAAAPTAAPAAKPTTAPAAAAAVIPIVVQVSGDSIQGEAKTGKPGEGKFGAWYEVEVLTSHLQKFNDANPGIKATVDWYTGTPQAEKILAKKAAGQLGDIIHGLGLPLDAFARNEVLRPLDDLVKNASFDLGQYVPGAVDALRFDPKTGKYGSGQPLYGLPSQGGPGATILFYNVDLFTKKGAKPPTTDMSFSALIELAQSLTERQSGAEVADVYGFLGSPFWFADVYASWLRDFGAEMWDAAGKQATVNTKEARDAFKFIYDTIYTSKIAPRPDQLAALGQYKNMFIQQKLAMFRLAPWGVLATSDAPLKGEPGYFEWDAIRMPKGPGSQFGSNLTASYMGVAPSTKNPDAAFKVLAWLTNKDAGVLQCFNAGMCGPRPDVLTDDRVKQSKFVQTVNSTITEAKPPRYAANGRDSEAVSAMGKEFDKLINDQAKPDQSFFDNMNKLVQDVLDKPAG